jgi:hypothetical protein
MYHAGNAQQASVGVDDGRGVVGLFTRFFEEVEDRYHTVFLRETGKGPGKRAGYGFGDVEKIALSRPLRIEGRECEFGEGDESGAPADGFFESLNPSFYILFYVISCVLLDQGDFELFSHYSTILGLISIPSTGSRIGLMLNLIQYPG